MWTRCVVRAWREGLRRRKLDAGARGGRIRAQAIGAGLVAAEEAAHQASVGSGETADELDLQGADAAVCLGHVGEGTGVLADEALVALNHEVGETAALTDDRLDLGGPFGEGLAVHPLHVGLGEAGGHPSQEALQDLRARQGADLVEQGDGELVVLLGVEGVARVGEGVDERGAADVAPLLVRLDEAVALQDGQVLTDARRGQSQELAQLPDRGVALAAEVIEDLLPGCLDQDRPPSNLR